MIGIYKITNLIDNKMYIGQSIHIERRFAEHCQPSAKGLVGRAIQKYGKENFSFQILEECSLEQLTERENYYIQYYNTIVPYGYNIEEGTLNSSIYYIAYGKDIFLEIVDALKNTNKLFSEIAQQYDLSTRTIIRLNQGDSHKLDSEEYPLRKVPKVPIKYCSDCGIEIPNRSRSGLCESCYRQFEKKVKDRPNREQLKTLIRTYSFTELGKIYGVSDNTIRKWCKKVNLPYRTSDIKNITDIQWNDI